MRWHTLRKEYQENMKKNRWTERWKPRTVKDKWENLKSIINEALIKKEIIVRRRELEDQDWWQKTSKRAFNK